MSISRSDAFRQDAQNRLDEERRRMQRLRVVEEDTRIRLIEKKGAEEAIQRLKEQEEEAFWKQYYSAEAGQLDEQALSGFVRRKRTAKT
jgi:flagellar biosynthesis chaperone FliJ